MEIIGYFEEHYINKKFVGNKICEKQEREIGFKGMKNNIAFEMLILDNKKTIKKNTEYLTIYYFLYGR